LDLGHEKVAYISDPLENSFNFTSSRDRFDGYRRALKRAGIPLRREYHQQGDHGHYQARIMAERLLDSEDPPTAIFAASDTQAMGVLEALRMRHLGCPEDIAIIGYDDIQVAEYFGLTTIRQPLYESGLRGVELLLNAMDKRERSPVAMELPVTLIERRTTRLGNQHTDT